MPENAKLESNDECPNCHVTDRPILLDTIPAKFHIPRRFLLKCSHCQMIYYRPVKYFSDAPDEA